MYDFRTKTPRRENMETWLVVVIGAVCLIVGVAIGGHTTKR